MTTNTTPNIKDAVDELFDWLNSLPPDDYKVLIDHAAGVFDKAITDVKAHAETLDKQS
jgi:UV DNA damage repair endonuclease